MIFTTQVAHTLGYDSATRLSDALSAAYAEALQPYHGWMATTAFRVRHNELQDQESVARHDRAVREHLLVKFASVTFSRLVPAPGRDAAQHTRQQSFDARHACVTSASIGSSC